MNFRLALRLAVFLGTIAPGTVSTGAETTTQPPSEIPTTPPRPKPGDQSLTLEVNGTKRHSTVHVPNRAPVNGVVYPIVIMLHGGGGTSRAAAYETGWNAKADKTGFIVVYPDALARDPARKSHFSRNPQLWNDGSERLYPNQKPADDIAFINALLDDLQKRFPTDPRRIYITGFSNGAGMAFRIAAELSPRIAAIAPMAGACWIDPGPLAHPVPLCYLTGTADPLNLIEGGAPKMATGASDPVRAKPKPPVRATIQKWARAIGCPTELTTTDHKNGIRTETFGPLPGGAEIVYLAIDNHGHAWPGGKSILPESLVGPCSPSLSATDFIWDFFARHSLPAASKPKASPAATAPPENVESHRDLAYVDGGHERQKLDLFLPKNRTSTHRLPVILWVHGGGWAHGAKDRCPPLRQGFVGEGYAVASIGYRLTGTAKFPAQIEDCKAAVRWLRAHADEYGLDTQRFCAWGGSAGGHLVALLGTTGEIRNFDVGAHLDQSSAVQAVIDFYGPANFVKFDKPLQSDSPESVLLGGLPAEQPETARAASPALQVKRDAPVAFLILHGDKDKTVWPEQSIGLDKALKAAGIPSEFHLLPGASHGGPAFTSPEALVWIRTFLKRALPEPK